MMANSPSKSTSSRKSSVSKSKSIAELPVKLDSNDNVSIRQIENGYLVCQSGYKGKGKNQQWFNKEYFTATNPISFSGKKK